MSALVILLGQHVKVFNKNPGSMPHLISVGEV